MKRLTSHILLIIAAMLALSGCSHNNGDIGPWFGLWHLDSLEIDGNPDSSYDGNLFFLFQGKVFCLRWVNENTHEYIDCYAKWEESDDGTSITVNFADPRYNPEINNGLPNSHMSTITTFRVLIINEKDMVLEHIDQVTGSTLTYRLTKWQ